MVLHSPDIGIQGECKKNAAGEQVELHGIIEMGTKLGRWRQLSWSESHEANRAKVNEQSVLRRSSKVRLRGKLGALNLVVEVAPSQLT